MLLMLFVTSCGSAAQRGPVNFATDVVEAADPSRTALIALEVAGNRREISFGDLGSRAARLAGTLAANGVRARGRRHDRDRKPPGVGGGDGGLLPDWRGRAPLHRAAEGEGPPGADRAGEAARGRGRRAGRSDHRGDGIRRTRAGGAGRTPLRRAAGPGRRPVAGGSGAHHLHVRDGGRTEAHPPRTALPDRPADPGRALVRRPPRATSAGAPPRRAGPNRRATCSSPRG